MARTFALMVLYQDHPPVRTSDLTLSMRKRELSISLIVSARHLLTQVRVCRPVRAARSAGDATAVHFLIDLTASRVILAFRVSVETAA